MLRAEQIAGFDMGRLPLTVRELGSRVLANVLTRSIGIRPSVVPPHMRALVARMGIDGPSLNRALRSIRRPGDWAYAWEAEGDRHFAAGQTLAASASYYMGQRALLTATPHKVRLYRQAAALYLRAPHTYPLQRLWVDADDHEQIACLLQLPAAAPDASSDGVPVIVLAPGMIATKEEFHPLAEDLLAAGFAVCRFDNPGYGETTGTLHKETAYNAAAVVEALRQDARIDPSEIHLVGTSMGGYWALMSATRVNVTSVVTVAAPFHPARYFHRLPTTNITALKEMIGTTSYRRLAEVNADIEFRSKAHLVTCPVHILHGMHDHTVPIDEADRIAASISGPALITRYRNGTHNCLEHYDELLQAILDWCTDASAVIARNADSVVDDSRRAAHSLLHHVPSFDTGSPATAMTGGELDGAASAGDAQPELTG